MNPNIVKEDLTNGFECDFFLTWCQNGHLKEPIKNHKDTIITILGGGKT
jgi:hypothetical protein